jgi:hypothetical protein
VTLLDLRMALGIDAGDRRIGRLVDEALGLPLPIACVIDARGLPHLLHDLRPVGSGQ